MDTTRRVPVPGRNATAFLLLAPLLLLGCADLPPAEVPSPNRAEGLLITRAQIEDSGARNGWEAIRRNVNHLRFSEDINGDLVWIGAVRGNQSIVAPDALLLVVDGTQMLETTYLQQIPARTIAYIQILSGLQGTARFGAGGGNGVIIVQTLSPSRGIAQGG